MRELWAGVSHSRRDSQFLTPKSLGVMGNLLGKEKTGVDGGVGR